MTFVGLFLPYRYNLGRGPINPGVFDKAVIAFLLLLEAYICERDDLFIDERDLFPRVLI